MNYQHWDLGHLTGGEIVEVIISGAGPNVLLMNTINYNAFKRGKRHRYIGGLARKSPVRLQVPSAGAWHLVVHFGGYKGRAKIGVNVLPGKLKPIREAPLSSLPSLLHLETPPEVENGDEKEFDVFISHASEDKDDIVRELAEALQAAELSVWYDEFELKIGSSLRKSIDKGLSNSRFGIVVLSPSFLEKGWTNYELDGLVTRANSGEQILLPIWHKLTKREVMNYSPSLADKLARNTATNTVEEIANEIVDVIRGGAGG